MCHDLVASHRLLPEAQSVIFLPQLQQMLDTLKIGVKSPNDSVCTKLIAGGDREGKLEHQLQPQELGAVTSVLTPGNGKPISFLSQPIQLQLFFQVTDRPKST